MAFRPRPRSLLAVVLACAAIGGALPAGALAHVTCGATITRDVVLDADLDCRTSGPIRIGADRVTFDLNGHSIIGGILIEGHRQVTIRNGTVVTVVLRDAHRNRLKNLTLDTGDGHVELTDSNRNLIEGITGGAIAGGITLIRSDRNLIRGNDLSGFQTTALFADEGSDRNVISGNNASAIGGSALAVGGSRNWIAHNTASGVTFSGSGIQSDGILLFAGSRNVLLGNTVSGQPDGISVAEATSRTLVAYNKANGSSDDGIDIDSPRTTLRRNTANDNGDLGIEAVPGVRDAGGNRAAGNGNPLQCLNVACARGAAATVFTGSATDPANDLAPDFELPLPEPPVDFTNVSVRYDAVAGRVDVSYRFSRAPAAYQQVSAGVGLGTVQPDGSCNAPILTDLSWRSESANPFRGEAAVEGHSMGFTGSVTGLIFDPGAGGATFPTASFEWSASRRTWDFATIHPALVGRRYTCAHAGMFLLGGPPGSATRPGVDVLDSQPFPLSPVSPHGAVGG